MSAIDDILEVKTATDTAAAGGAMSVMGKALAGGAGAAVAGAAVAGAGIAAQKIYDAMTKARDFRAMMGSSFNHDLHPIYQARPKEFNEAYSSLRYVNPEFSKDPMVAGTYMRRTMSFDPAQAGGLMVEALSQRGNMPESQVERAFMGGAVGGASKGMEAGMRDAGIGRGLKPRWDNESEGPQRPSKNHP